MPAVSEGMVRLAFEYTFFREVTGEESVWVVLDVKHVVDDLEPLHAQPIARLQFDVVLFLKPIYESIDTLALG